MLIDELDQKIQRFEGFLQADPANKALLIELGDLCHQRGQSGRALDLYDRARAQSGTDAVLDGRLASVYLTEQRFAEAESILLALVGAGDTNPALLHNLGLAQFHQAKFAMAAQNFSAAASAGLTSPQNAKYLAFSLHHTGQMDAAIDACQHWIKLDPSAEAQAYSALLSFDRGDRAVAKAAAESVLGNTPDSVDANTVLGSLALEEQDIGTASACFERVLAQRPDNGRAWLGVGLCALHQHKNVAAIDAMNRATTCMPQHAGTHVALAWTKLTSADVEGAAISFRKAIDADRNFAEAHGGLAAALAEAGRIDEAKRAIEIADKLDAHNFGAVYAKAILLKREGRSELADRLISRALQQSPVAGGPTLQAQLSQVLGRRPQ